ncbi:N-acetylglucosamine-6-phosphate deacetylase [Nitrospirillum sp. BR 11164]|uniref:N-acetylglucosamine-6-phosphate deacetylase n=1 Tax=Nitrospirillum sp. BR 11164 TaxID=3104324 RepID=UPI002AFEEB01|nr:N-acetylglucosamine-6-phosphate deacetylase [Nitrospirillum sp. BR 11164]MEA1649191.1 N-acetylglucosamine-6-phosphate deacetylase [Nitrospirillum sp. BR 11164]
MRTFFHGCPVFTGDQTLEGIGVLVEEGRVLDLLPRPPAGAVEEVALEPDSLLAPGFVDTQVNGGGGVLFNETPTAAAALAIASAHRRFGTTSLLPTFITDAAGKWRLAVDAAAEAAQVPGGGVVGIHLEGPFLNMERRGVHEAAYVRAPTDEDIAFLLGLPARFPGGRVLLTLAPEVVGDETLARLAEAGLILAGGHSAATYARTDSALNHGLTGFTHLFNAMPPLMNREPGIAGAALSSPRGWCGVIADGVHVHGAMLRLALAAKGPDRVFLVTDAMSPTGTDVDSFELYGHTIYRRDGRLVTADGVLAGADIDMAAAVRGAIRLMGVAPETALTMAARVPATFLGLDDLGRITPGARADFVELSQALTVRRVWSAGAER